MKNTKIICTIGPASQSLPVLKKMIRAGMNVARLNFSHGTYDEFRQVIKNIREASKETNIPVGIMQDLQGPKIRVGEMPQSGIEIKNKQEIVLTTRKIPATKSLIPVQYKNLPKDVKKNDRIMINDGLIELKVLQKNNTDIYCTVVTGGTVFSHKGINVPTGSISAKCLTDKDKKDLAFGMKNDVDYVALSFVRSAKDIEELRALIRHHRGQAKIVAKIERHEAIDNLEEIIDETDAVMVARGDLGVEVSPAQVPLLQKRMIHLANIHGKPVITATEMLQSMIENARPTRAEISDVANAVFDHTDAVMLSNESAVGKYPVKAVEYMTETAISIEKDIKRHEQFLQQKLFTGSLPVSYATCANAAQLAKNIDADLIVAITRSGFTAQHIAKHRIYIPIVVITNDIKVQKQLQLVWGIHKVIIKNIPENYSPKTVKRVLVENELVNPGAKVVVVSNASTDQKIISTITI